MLSMKGRIYMSPRVIDVELTVSGEADILLFHLDSESPEKYSVNLNSSSSQIELKEIFSKLLDLLISEDLELELKIADGYTKGLYKDVCSEYISDLNREILQVKARITRELA